MAFRIGRIAGVFGVLGELKLDPTSAGEPLFVDGARFTAILKNGTRREIELTSVRSHKNRLLVFLAGVQGAHNAELYSDAVIETDRERVVAELAEDEILDADLIGLKIVDAAGKQYGTVKAVDHLPGSSMLRIEPGQRYLPYVKHFVKKTDLAAGLILVEVPPGLLDDDAIIDLAEPEPQ